MIWTAVLISLDLVCIFCNQSHKTRFLYEIPRFGTVVFKLLIHLLEHDCCYHSLKFWIVQLWNYLSVTLILLCVTSEGLINSPLSLYWIKKCFLCSSLRISTEDPLPPSSLTGNKITSLPYYTRESTYLNQSWEKQWLCFIRFDFCSIS